MGFGKTYKHLRLAIPAKQGLSYISTFNALNALSFNVQTMWLNEFNSVTNLILKYMKFDPSKHLNAYSRHFIYIKGRNW